MQTSKPAIVSGGPCPGLVLECSTVGFGQPVAYIAIPVSGPPQTQPEIQTSPTTKQQRRSALPEGLTERLRKAIGGLGVAQILTGLASIIAESIAFGSESDYMSIGAGIWCGVIFFITGVIAVRTAKTRRFTLIITTMVMSTISACFFKVHLSMTAAFIKGDWNSLPQVVRSLELVLSVLNLIFSIACSACCCKAVCRKGLCCCCFVDFATYQNPLPMAHNQVPQTAAPTIAPGFTSLTPSVVQEQAAVPAEQSGGQLLHPPDSAFTP